MNARAPHTPRESLRFKRPPVNRATGFSQIAHSRVTRSRLTAAHHWQIVLAIGNAVGTARIYIRQAKRSYRHGILALNILKQSRRVKARTFTGRSYRATDTLC
jgi:hypothetical protein